MTVNRARLDDIRKQLAATRAYFAKHGILYDAPSVDPDDIEFLLAEVDRLNADVAARKRETRQLLVEHAELRAQIETHRAEAQHWQDLYQAHLARGQDTKN